MMTPDSRPIGVLTPAILATASHWCIHRKGIADIRPSSTLVLRVSDFDDDLPLLTCEGECYWNDDSGWMCYPCTLQPNGLVVPEPWPVLEGDVEIDALRGYAQCSDAPDYYYDEQMCWFGIPGGDDGVFPIVPQKPNMHPALRKGKAGPVWVWEKDR